VERRIRPHAQDRLATALERRTRALRQLLLRRARRRRIQGGRQGTTFQITLGGRCLDDIKRVYFSGSGVEARVQGKIEPMKSDEVNPLRKRLTELNRLPRDKRDAKVRMEIAGIERKVARNRSQAGDWLIFWPISRCVPHTP